MSSNQTNCWRQEARLFQVLSQGVLLRRQLITWQNGQERCPGDNDFSVASAAASRFCRLLCLKGSR